MAYSVNRLERAKDDRELRGNLDFQCGDRLLSKTPGPSRSKAGYPVRRTSRSKLREVDWKVVHVLNRRR
jgi:hypothetical protein